MYAYVYLDIVSSTVCEYNTKGMLIFIGHVYIHIQWINVQTEAYSTAALSSFILKDDSNFKN